MTLDRSALETWAAPHRERIQTLMLERFGGAFPDRFREACRYPLQTGGKRIRPLLTLAAAECLGGDPTHETALGAAAAVELIHTYSLVHDDLPAMDDDDMRRGKPTVHRVYGEDGAILVGDALLTEAFRLLAGLPASGEVRAAMIGALADAAGHLGMVGGQALDVGVGGAVTDLDGVLRLHRGKTGALIRVAVRLGGLAAGASDAQLSALTRYGESVGLAFQLADDILDADQDAGEDGPPSVVKLLGIAETRRRADAMAADALAAVQDLPKPGVLLALARFTVEREV